MDRQTVCILDGSVVDDGLVTIVVPASKKGCNKTFKTTGGRRNTWRNLYLKIIMLKSTDYWPTKLLQDIFIAAENIYSVHKVLILLIGFLQQDAHR